MGNKARAVLSAFATIFVAIAWTTKPSAGDILRIDTVIPDAPIVANCTPLAKDPVQINMTCNDKTCKPMSLADFSPSTQFSEPVGKQSSRGIQEPEPGFSMECDSDRMYFRIRINADGSAEFSICLVNTVCYIRDGDERGAEMFRNEGTMCFPLSAE